MGLALSMTVVVELANLRAMSSGGPPLLDLAGLFGRLRDHPGDVSLWWVYLTLFSTFVPTLLHLRVMATALFTVTTPGWIRHWVLERMEQGFKGDVRNQMLVAGFFTGRLVLAIVLVCFGLLLVGLGLWYCLPGLGKLWLYYCSEVQQRINPSALPVYDVRPRLISV